MFNQSLPNTVKIRARSLHPEKSSAVGWKVHKRGGRAVCRC